MKWLKRRESSWSGAHPAAVFDREALIELVWHAGEIGRFALCKAAAGSTPLHDAFSRFMR